jgi:predicted dehydrogenase/L-amino acid N-acyltransferase YncA
VGHGLTVAVLGQGSIGRRHAGLLRELGCEVITYDPVAGGSASSEDAAIGAADAVVVASPSSEHARQAEACVGYGVPALVEKPLALDAPTASRLERLAADAGVPLAVAMNLRHHPGVRAVRDALPEIGRPLRAAVWCGSWLPGWRPRADYRRSYSASRSLGGGILLDAIHEVDELLWLLGPARTVSALLPTVSDLEIDVEDVALLQIELESGAPATVTLDYLDRDYHRGCRIVGAVGTIAWEWTREEAILRAEADVRRVPAPSDVAPTYRAELKDFLTAVQSGGPLHSPAKEALPVMALIDAARAAHLESRRVSIGIGLRRASNRDSERVRAWRNDPAAIEASLTQAAVGPREHAEWYARVVCDPAHVLWVIEENGRGVGSLRLSRIPEQPCAAEVSIVLEPGARGRGLSGGVLEAAARAAPDALGIEELVASVRPENSASIRAFTAAGYEERARDARRTTLVRRLVGSGAPGSASVA